MKMVPASEISLPGENKRQRQNCECQLKANISKFKSTLNDINYGFVPLLVFCIYDPVVPVLPCQALSKYLCLNLQLIESVGLLHLNDNANVGVCG